MENASKALMMAGGILLSLMIIGLVVFAFGKINESREQSQRDADTAQALEYNKRFEQYNKKILYGSDIISAINRVEDYNAIEADEDSGFKPITIEINIINQIALVDRNWDSNYKDYTITSGLHKDPNDVTALKRIFNNIDRKTEELEGQYTNIGKLINLQNQYKYQLSSSNYEAKLKEYSIDKSKRLVDIEIEVYKTLSSTLSSFRTKFFSCEGIEYDNNSRRVSVMKFKEVNPD